MKNELFAIINLRGVSTKLNKYNELFVNRHEHYSMMKTDKLLI